MRDPPDQRVVLKASLASLAILCVLALVRTASAQNDLDMREVFRPQPSRGVAPQPETARDAGAAPRPLRIALQPPRRQPGAAARRARLAAISPVPRAAARGTRAPRGAAALRAAAAPGPAFAILPPPRDMLFAPLPSRPAIVSIYEDQTLRRGDAVMMADGIHVFNGRDAGPHVRRDFVRLPLVASLDWRLRTTLGALDTNPPDRWRS